MEKSPEKSVAYSQNQSTLSKTNFGSVQSQKQQIKQILRKKYLQKFFNNSEMKEKALKLIEEKLSYQINNQVLKEIELELNENIKKQNNYLQTQIKKIQPEFKLPDINSKNNLNKEDKKKNNFQRNKSEAVIKLDSNQNSNFYQDSQNIQNLIYDFNNKKPINQEELNTNQRTTQQQDQQRKSVSLDIRINQIQQQQQNIIHNGLNQKRINQDIINKDPHNFQQIKLKQKDNLLVFDKDQNPWGKLIKFQDYVQKQNDEKLEIQKKRTKQMLNDYYQKQILEKQYLEILTNQNDPNQPLQKQRSQPFYKNQQDKFLESAANLKEIESQIKQYSLQIEQRDLKSKYNILDHLQLKQRSISNNQLRSSINNQINLNSNVNISFTEQLNLNAENNAKNARSQLITSQRYNKDTIEKLEQKQKNINQQFPILQGKQMELNLIDNIHNQMDMRRNKYTDQLKETNKILQQQVEEKNLNEKTRKKQKDEMTDADYVMNQRIMRKIAQMQNQQNQEFVQQEQNNQRLITENIY